MTGVNINIGIMEKKMEAIGIIGFIIGPLFLNHVTATIVA